MQLIRHVDMNELRAALVPYDEATMEVLLGYNVWSLYEGFARENIAQTGTQFPLTGKQGTIAELHEAWQRWIKSRKDSASNEALQRHELALRQIRELGHFEHPPILVFQEPYIVFAKDGKHRLFAAYEHCLLNPGFEISVLRGRNLGIH